MTQDAGKHPIREKIDQLNQQAWDARVHDSPRSFLLSQESVGLAGSINYQKGLAEGLRSLGFCYVRRSENEKGLVCLNESFSLFESLGDLQGNKVQISVRDNAPGIPEKLLDKIFHSFFTTKPIGQGTGLSLSLSYDIVKAHGGELSVRTPLEKVETRDGVGSTFIISLPQ